MLARFRNDPLIGNVLGLVALFIALGAGAYAAGLAPNSVKSKQIKDGQVKSADIGKNQVKGADVRESTLSGLGANDGYFGTCDPQNTTFDDCASTTVTLERQMNVLVIATTHFNTFGDTAPAFGNCRLEQNDVAVSNDHPIGELDPVEDTNRRFTPTVNVHQGGMTLVDVEKLAAGTYTFEVSCNELDADIEYPDQRVAAVKLSQD